MLYGIGLILLLLSTAFVGGTVMIPMGIAVTGVTLMVLGRRTTDGNNTKR